MPTYEYRCTDCGNRVEVFQRIGDVSPTVCEVCGGTLRKVFHPAGIVFKGSGFYATDSRKARAGSGDGKRSSEKGGGEKGGGEKGGAEKGGGEKGGSEKGGSETKSSETGGSEKGPSKTSSSDAASKGKSS
jgi:putative FmdB family regulatory protein